MARKPHSQKTKKNYAGRQYGNHTLYLVGRVRRDSTEWFEKWRAGEMSIHAAAIGAGVIEGPPPPEMRKLEALFKAWAQASLDERRSFLALCGEEIMAAQDSEYLNLDPDSPFKGRCVPYKPAVEYADLEHLIRAGVSLSEIARKLEVSYRTVARWRAGKTRPGPDAFKRLREQTDALCAEGKGNEVLH